MGISTGARFLAKATMPSRPRVMTSDSSCMRCKRVWPAFMSKPLLLPIWKPSASSTSGSLGVEAVMPVYSSRR